MFRDIDINSLIGIPYKDRGDTIQGFDCAGLVRYVTGIEANLIPSIEIGHTKEVMKAIIKHKRHFNILEEPKEGCIVSLSRLKYPHHVGVYLQGGVLHATPYNGVVFSSFLNLKENGFTLEFGELKNG